MTAKVKKHLDYLKLLTSTHVKQRRELINTISNEQLSVLTEAIFNVLKGVCSLSNINKNRLCKNKTSLRKLVDPKVSRKCKKTILKQIQNLIPELLRTVIRYFSNDGKGSDNGSTRKIHKIDGNLREEIAKSE